MPAPYTVLLTYRPKLWKAWKVGKDITEITRRYGLVPHVDPTHGPLTKVPWHSDILHAEVRKKTFNTKQAEDWHKDGDTTPGSSMDCCLVLWASDTPTEFQVGGKIYQPQPFEIVIARNLGCSHRRPAGCRRDRWVFRQRVAVPAWLGKEENVTGA